MTVAVASRVQRSEQNQVIKQLEIKWLSYCDSHAENQRKLKTMHQVQSPNSITDPTLGLIAIVKASEKSTSNIRAWQQYFPQIGYPLPVPNKVIHA